jgi:hypothetical protein
MLDSRFANRHFSHGLVRDLTTMNTVLVQDGLRERYRHSQVHHKYGQAMHVHEEAA